MATDATGTPSSLGIPTYNPAADSPSGLGFNAAIAAINTLLQDRVTVAGTRVLANKLLSGDAQPAFRIMGDGKLEWGPGGASAPDASITRDSSGALLFTAVAAGASGPFVASSGTNGVVSVGVNSSMPTILFGNVFTGVGTLYLQSGALKYQGSSGTVTTIAPA